MKELVATRLIRLEAELWIRTLDADGREIGYIDAFRLLDYCSRYNEENGLDQSYLDKITRSEFDFERAVKLMIEPE